MNEHVLIEQVLRIINNNYSNIYVIDIQNDITYLFDFNLANSLVIKDKMSYTDFIDYISKFVHPEELNSYFEVLSLPHLESEAQKGNNETKFKYRKLCETGEYRYFINIINYLPFDGKKLIFMMSEDVNERLIDTEEKNINLETEVSNYKNRIESESESIGNAIYQINNLLENNKDSSIFTPKDTKQYINSIFNGVSSEHPELANVIHKNLAKTDNFVKPTILIVDDSSIIRNSLKRIFENEFEIMMAKDGNEAISIINENVLNNGGVNIVGVLLDLIMPGSDGFTVLDYLKTLNLFNKLPVAIISGDESRETRKRVYEYDIVDMLEKPFNTDNIRRRISKIINLYLSSNNLENIIEKQNRSSKDNKIKEIITNIVKNISVEEGSIKAKKIARIIAINLNNLYPEVNLDTFYVDAIVNGVCLYNIGAISMNNDEVITVSNISKEIEYGLAIIDEIYPESKEKEIIKNIIKYSCEMYNGNGYPNGIDGTLIPIEAQITNLVNRLNNGKSLQTNIKDVLNTESNQYNPILIETLSKSKKELKNI